MEIIQRAFIPPVKRLPGLEMLLITLASLPNVEQSCFIIGPLRLFARI